MRKIKFFLFFPLSKRTQAGAKDTGAAAGTLGAKRSLYKGDDDGGGVQCPETGFPQFLRSHRTVKTCPEEVGLTQAGHFLGCRRCQRIGPIFQ